MKIRLFLCSLLALVTSCGNAPNPAQNNELTPLQKEYLDTITDIQFGDKESVEINSDVIWPQVHIYVDGRCAEKDFEILFKGNEGAQDGSSFNAVTTCFSRKLPDKKAAIDQLSKSSGLRQKYATVYDLSKSNPKKSEWIGTKKKIFHANLIVNVSKKVEKNRFFEDGYFSSSKFCSVDYASFAENYNVVLLTISASETNKNAKDLDDVVQSKQFSECIFRGNLLASGLLAGNSSALEVDKFSPYCAIQRGLVRTDNSQIYFCNAQYQKFGKYLYKLDIIKTQFPDKNTRFGRVEYRNIVNEFIKKLDLE
jgi:hypothetical protein